MSFIDEMANLRVSVDETKKRTAAAVGQIKKDSKKIRRRAQEMVRELATAQKATAAKLRKDLKSATEELKSEVEKMRGDNIREQKGRRREFAQAQTAFWKQESKTSAKKGKES